MPLFEKIHNHTLQRVLLSEKIATPLTLMEKGWLKRLLAEPAAGDLLSPSLLAKLQDLLKDEVPFPCTTDVEEKGRSTVRYAASSPILKKLQTAIREHRGIRLDYVLGSGEEHSADPAFPQRLEFSLVRQEWYLLWLRLVPEASRPYATPLRNIGEPTWQDLCRTGKCCRRKWRGGCRRRRKRP